MLSLKGTCETIYKKYIFYIVVLFSFQIAIKLLLHKIKSPQPKEAIQALTVLEACVKNCGEQFHNKLGNHEVIDELTNLVLNIV